MRPFYRKKGQGCLQPTLFLPTIKYNLSFLFLILRIVLPVWCWFFFFLILSKPTRIALKETKSGIGKMSGDFNYVDNLPNNILQQALEGIPGGPYENLEIRCFDRERDPEWNDFEYRFISKKPSPTFELPRQELYARMEAPKGELGIFLIGDQSGFPWRWKIRPPGFINLQILPHLFQIKQHEKP
ncbi:NAD(P)H dehydrogenase subunit H, putative [Theobroma cacao]|uniref:NAD(P)H dehydrogenase subunit H, putative n=1 Tax=Theobroma cacao TaxID=3641 RepID=A0A061DQK9_THECC|nr:NAD(P)H dehydrogenase subunit H, putative [Theobroma cacao]